MHLAPNTLLQGRYRVQNLIAQGGMGAVYRAVDERLGHTVARKQTLMTDPQLRAAFEQEARLLAGLHHSAHAINPDVPIALGDLLTSALALDPERRPPAAAAMRTAIRDLNRPTPSSSGVVTVALGAAAPPTQIHPHTGAPPTVAAAPLPAHPGAQSSRSALVLFLGLGALALFALVALGVVLITLTTRTGTVDTGIPTVAPVTVLDPATTGVAAQPTAAAAPLPVENSSGGTRAAR
jgi:hypothetical protein